MAISAWPAEGSDGEVVQSGHAGQLGVWTGASLARVEAGLVAVSD